MAFVFSSALTILGIALQNRQLTSIERSSELWKDAAEHDPLTGLINRRAFLPRLQNEHQRALRTGNTYTFAMLDLDHFKSINDAYGHHCGDAVLCALAQLWSKIAGLSMQWCAWAGKNLVSCFPSVISMKH